LDRLSKSVEQWQVSPAEIGADLARLAGVEGHPTR